MTAREFVRRMTEGPSTPRMPALFVGHGNPMNGVEDNRWARGWTAIAAGLPRPRAVLCVSAHWLSEGTFVHGEERPKTIHDFFGFPPELYAKRYPCPGAPDVAREAQRTLAPAQVGWDVDWGVDHGAWIVLCRMYPDADVPAFQLSIDVGKTSRAHYDLGRALAPLRDKGVLIVGSGNLVHNLGMIAYDEGAKPFDWAVEFDAQAAALIAKGDHDALIAHEKLGHAARLAVPTPDHYWPLLYALGLRGADEPTSFPMEGIAQGSIGMRCVRIG